jgi:hypothetical protein
MSAALKTNDGRLIVVSGASRCGKTTQVANETKNERRICAFDPEAQWCTLPGWRKVTSRRELIEAMQARGHVRVAFVPGPDLKSDFDFWSAVVFHAGRFFGPLVAIAEELADVTTPSKAPGNWGILLRRGLKRGITIYAISQRWAEADKTAIGNCSEFLIFTSRGDDVDYIARKARVPVEELDALEPFHFLRVDPVTKARTPGKVRFR